MAGNIFRRLSCPSLIPFLLPISVSLVFLLGSCASRKEVVRLQHDINRLKSQVVNLRKDNEKKAGEIENKIAVVESNIKESIRPVRKNQADISARLDEMQTQIQSLKGKIEEYQYLLDQQNRENISLKKISESEFEKRLRFLEGFFISEGVPSTVGKPPKGKSPGENKKKTARNKKPTSKELYSKAYKDFKNGDIKAARRGFRKYLKLFPNTVYSDNAQYWLGESFFMEKKYGEAILEFEEVIRKYPEGNKVPNALLKQGLAFYRLGDKTSARLLLQKVVKKYPGSHQAKIAKRELKKLR